MTVVPPVPRNGGQILMQQLRIHGARRVFLVPGESYLPCIDALHEHAGAIEPVVCRQESGAAYMAEAYGKLTGEPGICFVTRGPGATNASIGVHTAFQDSTPMILFVGQVGNDFMEREAFQEIDYRRMFGPMAKWVAQIDRCDRIPEFIARAYATATSGRPGPVVLALPEDTLWGTAAVPDMPRYQRVPNHPGAPDLERLRAALDAARHPFLLLGGSGWTARAVERIAAFAQAFELPVGTAWRRLECFDQRHPNAAGQVGWGMTDALRARLAAADLILAVGTRLGEATTEGYLLPACPLPAQRLIHVHPDPEELGRVYQPWQAVVAGPTEFAEAAATLIPGHAASRAQAVRQAHQEYLDSLEPLPAPGPLSLDALAAGVNQRLPADACVTVGAGNYALYPHRYRQFAGPGTSLAPTLGAMGYGLAGGPVRQARTSAAHGGLLRRRRLLPDEHAGTRRRPAVPPGRRGAGVQQRHVGHHPRAPGTRVSRPSDRAGLRESRFRADRARLPWLRRNRDAHRGLRRRLRARAGLCRARTPARAAGHPLRRRRHRARPDPVGHPRRRPGAPGRSLHS